MPHRNSWLLLWSMEPSLLSHIKPPSFFLSCYSSPHKTSFFFLWTCEPFNPFFREMQTIMRASGYICNMCMDKQRQQCNKLRNEWKISPNSRQLTSSISISQCASVDLLQSIPTVDVSQNLNSNKQPIINPLVLTDWTIHIKSCFTCILLPFSSRDNEITRAYHSTQKLVTF